MSRPIETRWRWFVAAAALIVSLTTTPAMAGEASGVHAEFEGTTIDLTVDWGDAAACHIGAAAARCFRSEAAMDRWLANGGGATYDLSRTQAYDSATSMLSGWNNDISAVWIH